jgi:hypothetical protein
VFDPLALTLLLAATKSIEWERGVNILQPAARKPEEDKAELDSEVTEFFDRAREKARDIDTGTYEPPEEEPIKQRSILAGLDSMWARAKKIATRDTEAEHAPLEQPTVEIENSL